VSAAFADVEEPGYMGTSPSAIPGVGGEGVSVPIRASATEAGLVSGVLPYAL